ncbi:MULTISPECIES: flagellar protein FlaG [Chitinibacter]|uniref:flagellar protein FlaG n=1 Tax=Chitinibacter TaxID=230666 RepID=UPI0004220EAC|nr:MULTISPECIES: flagellar protein FlaG [Chitinibacter]
MQINSVNGLSQTPGMLKDEGQRQVAVSGLRSESAAPAVAVASDAVQALDPKQQAKQLDDAVKKINETISSMNRDVGLEFSTDEATKMRTVKIIDIASKEILRQIPSEEVLNIAKAIDRLQGLLVRDKA